MSMDRLLEAIVKTQNPTVVGLDPKLEYIPDHIKKKAFEKEGRTLKGAAKALYQFNKGIIDAICGTVPAVKPQAAYYEMYGWPGVKTLAKTIAYAQKKGLYVIIDGKRNDIGATMEAYATAHLGETSLEDDGYESAFGGDCLTVNGYLGSDGIAPLLKVCQEKDKGIFVLVKTSNPSSGELQDRWISEQKVCAISPDAAVSNYGNNGNENRCTVYEAIGDMCEEWGRQLPGKYGYSGVGAVVGATYPEQLSELRKRLPHTFFLVPGYGAQGGGAAGVAGAFDGNGMGAIVNSSRAVMCAWQKNNAAPEDYAMAALRECIRMKKDITAHIPTMLLK